MNVTWLWQIPTLVGIILLIASYGRGRRALLRQQDGNRPSHLSTSSFVLFLTGIIALAGALHTPLNGLASELFVFHVAQHLLVAAVAPAFFWFADPLPVVKAGLPAGLQRWLNTNFAPGTPLYEQIKKITPKGVAWILFVTVVWFWYDVIVHEATLTRPWLHFLELITVYIAASIYWWHIAGAAPRMHKPLPSFVHMIFVLGGAWPIKAVGAAAIFTENVIYEYPLASLNAWGMTAIDNQFWGGILIWGFGGLAFSTSAALYLRRWLGPESMKPVKTLDEILTDEKMLAPGIER